MFMYFVYIIEFKVPGNIPKHWKMAEFILLHC